MMTSPDHMSAVEWFDTLRVDFPESNFPLLHSENDWVETASYLKDSVIFGKNAPDPRHFTNWQEWAYALFNNMGGG